ncbi:four helix bundle protein [Pseudoalteromonas sp. HF66]|uniref:four helix bundle protein n=1 Tax=Pseudoalteromonas sp. HF66 TaxID=2721559 RepID=UPI001431B132|nr:four helix bundle protein [Pseudoalteromonas sp. HF66]NIZ07445.1 four helix bundle protein [Pseudoalteromonas sp. HF66]
MKFEQMDVWKKSSRLACDIYKVMFVCKDYGFKDQITRAALSIPSNIAEGLERETENDEARFLGSAGELVTQLYIGIEIKFIDKHVGLQLISEAKEVAAMIAALIKLRKGCVKESAIDYHFEEPRT